MKFCTACNKHEAPPSKQLCDFCRAYNRRKYKEYYNRRREIVFDFFGDKCACCGETERMFLSVDHINNDGNIQRKQTTDGGRDMYRKLTNAILAGNPPKDLQLLCRNCNWGKHVNGGVCPHTLRSKF